VRLDDAYLAALRIGLPQGAGMALGFDRLVMLLTGSSCLRDVLAFAWDEL
jgi:lysyl-tRNA synthetase class 2